MKPANALVSTSLLAALYIALPSIAAGQPPAMSGLVHHRPDGNPIECLHVALVDSLDRTVAHTVTDSAGMFVLVAPDTGSYRVQFDILGAEPLTGPLTRLAAGEMNEQEYPLSFDKRISGELEIVPRAQKSATVDLGDWHPALPERRLPLGHREISHTEMVQASTSAVELKRVAVQFIVDTTGRARASSWRTIASSDPNMEAKARSDFLAQRYTPARIGEQRVCQIVMTEMRYFRTGPNRPLKF